MNTTLNRNTLLSVIIFFVILFFSGSLCAATKTSAGTGNWSAPATWSPSGVPASGDDVIIVSGHVVTIDGAYTCNNLNLGNATATNTTLQITSAANSLTINGDLQINPSNKANTYILNSGPGTLNIAGTLSTWSSTGTNSIRASTGSINFTPAINLDNANKNITLTGAGTINFNSSFTDQYNKLVTFAGSTVNFANSYTVNTTAAVWVATAQANFTGNGSITPTASVTFGHVQINSSVSETLNSGAGTVIIAGNFTLAASSTFTSNMNFEVTGNWINNGATLNLGSNTVTLNGAAATIGGSASTTFATLKIGRTGGATAAAITMNTNATCDYLVLNGSTVARTLTLAAGTAFTVNNDVTLNQPTGAVTNALNINTATCNVNGNLVFSGNNATATRIARVAVTTGTFAVNGTVTWMANTAVATEVITVTTGTVTFGSSVTMGSNSGTLSVTSTGTINFNGAFTFGGAAAVPVFTTTNGCTVNFANDFTNNTNALTLAATSQTNFSGNGSITPNAAITFGHVQVNTSVSETLASGAGDVIIAGNLTLASGSTFTDNDGFEVTGNWINNGGTFIGGTNTVTLNGAAGTIGGTSSTTFATLQIGRTGGATAAAITMNTNTTCNYLVFNSSTVARTLTLGAVTFTVNNDVTINQPGAAVTNALNVNTATCYVNGNLIFSGNNATVTRIAKVAVTSGLFDLAGTVTWMANTVVATEVITVTTGTITFDSPLTMGSNSGTLSVTSTGTINFNGAFTFGGAATVPVFTTTNGCTINFSSNFTNSSNALTLAATSQTNFTGNGTITPNAAITFGHFQVNASVSETLALGAGAVIIAGNLTLATGSTLTDNDGFEVTGNWINNGGTFAGGSNTVTLNGAAATIGGSASTTFATLQIGRTGGATTAAITMNVNTTCNYLVLNGITVARTLTLGSGVTFTINNDVTLNQPTANSITNTLAVNSGICNVSGNLTFSGANNTASRVAKIDVTSGTFALTGSVTWMANTPVATEIITVSTGTITFGSSLTMGTGSGTLSVTSTGTINFNGASAPSFTFGGAATAPVFTTTNGCTLNFNNGFTNNSAVLTLAATSLATFTGSGIITPSAAITFGNIQINSGNTVTLAGNISLAGNWTNDGGTFTPGTNTVTFNGTGIQNIAKTGGETFYKIVGTNAAATVTLVNDVTITNNLTMTAANFNLNGNTLTLGSGAGATLTYTAGIAYGGTWKRWFPASAITSNSGSYFGLFPIGTPTGYRPVEINSTISPTTAGYVLASHTDAATITLVTYADNESDTIQVISNKQSVLSTSALDGGTYNLYVTLTGLSSTGSTTDMKLETYTSNTMGSAGTSVATSGTVSNPIVKRTGLSATNLSNTWVLGSKNKTSTPFRNCYYSRKNGNWNDVTPGNGTWSYTSGGAGASCDCTPVSGGYAIISANQTVTVNSNATVDYVDINTGGTLTDNGTNTLTITRDITTYGTGSFVNTSSWTVEGNISLSSGSASSTTGTLTLSGNVELGGTLALNTANLNLGTGSTLSGSGTITTTGGSVITAASSKTIAYGSNLTFGSVINPITFNISGATELTNNGTVKIYGDLTGNTLGSTWTNAAGSSLEVTGALLATGTLDVSASSNTVIYSGTAAQTIKVPSTSYSNLTINNAAGLSTLETTLISGELALVNGVINTTSSNPLKLTSTGSYSGGSADSYVNGPMVKVGNTSFIFPVGKSGKLMRVGVSGMSTATTEITAEYFSEPYSDTTNLSAELTQVSPVEYWDVDRTVTSDPVKLKFYWENAIESHMLNCNYLTIAHYKSGQWQKEEATVVSGACNGDAGGSIETNGYVSTFSPFGFGSSGGEALPIKLVSFNAIPQGNIVETNWSTELEINNAYFTVERSVDGSNFSEITRVEGAGNSTTLLKYNAIDENPIRGISYYRLRQTDFDGQYSYSNIVAVTISEQTGYKLFPNPAQGEFFVNVSNPSSEIQLNIYDMVGRKIYAKTVTAVKGSSNQTISVPTNDILPPGVYLVSTSTNGTEFKERVIVN